MPKPQKRTLSRLFFGAAAAAAAAAAWLAARPDPRAAQLLAGCGAGPLPRAAFEQPLDGTLFPPDLAAPLFTWRAEPKPADTWLLRFEFASGARPLAFVTEAASWRPPPAAWRAIRRACGTNAASALLVGASRADLRRPLCSARVAFAFSPDPVGAPIFFRDVNLPFSEAVKDPSRIRWRLGSVSSDKPPPVVLEHLPVCGNCHSFSRDGGVLGLDVDYANDKGSYALTATAPEVDLTPDKLITWSAFRPGDGRPTFGLLSQVSPDGRYVVGTVKDRSVFLARPALAYSQLFFPIQGILAVYDRQTRTFAALPGADDPAFVQSNPAWSPDGQTLVFARSPAYRLRNPARQDAVLLRQDECDEFLKEGRTFIYDLYRIPFNGGRGGAPEPLRGASLNGRSNYFAKYSPDGKWIAFCQAASFMLLQPDSALYLVPAEGGEASRLACNRPGMNSWHSWSPNSRWLVFAAKPGTPFTRLCLAHVDGLGTSSPAVCLDAFTEPNRAANIPEFVSLKPGGLRSIRERFVDDVSLLRAGNAFRDGGDFAQAAEHYRRALARNPGSAAALANLGTALSDLNQLDEAADCLSRSLAHAPASALTLYNLAVVRAKQGRFDEAIRLGAESVRLDPASPSAQSNLGLLLFERGRLDEAFAHLAEAVRLDPKKDAAHFALGRLFVRRGRLAEAAQCYAEAQRLAPDDERYLTGLAWLLATAPDPALRDGPRAAELAARLCELTRFEAPRALDILGASCAQAGRFPEAVRAATKALECARKQGQAKLAADIAARLSLYGQGRPYHQ